MANRKPMDTNTLSQKTKVLEKLARSACKSEKELLALDMERIINIDGISLQDMAIILELQKNVKAHTLYSYLLGWEKRAREGSDEP